MPSGGPSAIPPGSARPAPPIVVAGMHRSGISLAASWFAAGGIGVGAHPVPADIASRHDDFADLEVVELNARTLRAAVPAGEPGCPDWGWTESERWSAGPLAGHLTAAAALAAKRTSRGFPWGFKDPRATLLLDAWDEAMAGLEPCYLLVYRFPWGVADSLQRLGAAVFLERPDYAYRIWTFYNRRLLDFRRRHRERTLLLSADALAGDPAGLVRLSGRLAAAGRRCELPAAAPNVDRGRFATLAAADPLIGLVAAGWPAAIELLRELEREADLPASHLWSLPAPRAPRAAAAPEVPLSVIIPCYEMGELLLEAVASVERTVAEPYELLIVDDGSRGERTLAVLAVLEDAGYAVLRQENGGLSRARNRGIAASRGRSILPLDADNRLLPGFAAVALGVLAGDPGVGVVYGDRVEFGARSGRIQTPEFDLDSLLRANFIDACAVFRREVWEQCGGYDAAMPAMGWEDWDLWLGAAERGWAFHRLPAPTFEYRVRPGSMTSRLHSAEVGVPQRLYLFDKHRDLYRRRLPQLLTAQHLAAEAAADRARLAAERDRIETERDRIETERRGAVAERERLRGDLAGREAERSGLLAELADCRRHIELMEGTRAWRMRDVLLRLRGKK
jgi:GT2 family glycosyltransferase